MGRLAWYAGVSTALAGVVVVSAFNQRANFYSACVYLSQSNLCLMILINLILFIYVSCVYGLQRLCYGPLRPIEIEQLYEKAWFAITETCLAMTIFREEVGAWFLVMFVALLTGKVWGWIGDGRVEILEQQPPANPRLFHFRLSTSLIISVVYDMWLMSYIVNTVIQQARPNMMVMFLFEFAILTTSSLSTASRYGISLIEARVTKQQTHDRLIDRRKEVREERAEIIRQRDAATTAAANEGSEAPTFTEALPNEDDVDEMDIEVPGWEAKGQWVLTLDLVTDFIKLGIYVSFFCILLMFYGLPIHIMRDLFLTARSFIKRLTAFLRYRRATHDMNTRYEDASVEDIQREDTCIICREDMRPWSVTNPQIPPGAPGGLPPARPTATLNERSRPKKLPCGHVLHLGCLKSWLERQQVCPTCREPVVGGVARGARNGANGANAAGQGAQGGQPPAAGQQNGAGAPQAPAGRGGRGMRMLNLGPLRVGFGQANLQDLAQFGGAPADNAAAGNARVYGLELGFPRRQQAQPQTQGTPNGTAPPTTQEQLLQVEQQIITEIRALQATQQELHNVYLLQHELARIRLSRAQNVAEVLARVNPQNVDGAPAQVQMPVPMPQVLRQTVPFVPPPQQHMQRHGARPNTAAIPAGSTDLPPGVSIPEGWTLLPLQRLEGHTVTPAAGAGPAGTFRMAPTATTQTNVSSPIGGTSNNIPTALPLVNPEIEAQPLPVDSSDVNNESTSQSIIADQSDRETSLLHESLSPGTTLLTTPEPVNQANSPALPTWGSSQLFSAPGLPANTTNVADHTLRPELSSAEDIRSTMDTGHSSSISTETLNRGSEERRREKGKAKAATVEDSVDENEEA